RWPPRERTGRTDAAGTTGRLVLVQRVGQIAPLLQGSWERSVVTGRWPRCAPETPTPAEYSSLSIAEGKTDRIATCSDRVVRLTMGAGSGTLSNCDRQRRFRCRRPLYS